MSLLPSATFASSITPAPGVSDYAAKALWATAGSEGPGGGVTQLVAGSNITLDPPTGDGVVTISASAGAGGVTSVTSGGPGITCTPTTGAVVVDNTGVTQLVAGTGISVSGSTGAVTVTALGFPAVGYQSFSWDGTNNTYFNVTGNSFRISLDAPTNFISAAGTPGWRTSGFFGVSNASWNANTVVIVSLGGPFYYTQTVAPFLPVIVDGTISCGVPPGTLPGTQRRINLYGSDPVIPVGIGGTLGENAIYGWVVQGV